MSLIHARLNLCYANDSWPIYVLGFFLPHTIWVYATVSGSDWPAIEHVPSSCLVLYEQTPANAYNHGHFNVCTWNSIIHTFVIYTFFVNVAVCLWYISYNGHSRFLRLEQTAHWLRCVSTTKKHQCRGLHISVLYNPTSDHWLAVTICHWLSSLTCSLLRDRSVLRPVSLKSCPLLRDWSVKTICSLHVSCTAAGWRC
jgi:hypothetical protein